MEPRTRTKRVVRTKLWALSLMVAGTVIAPAIEMPNLSGQWQLNKDASDDPEKAKDARSPGSGSYGGGGMGRGGHGRGDGGGGGWGRGSRRDSGDSASATAGGWFVPLESLKIKHDEPALAITDAAGRERVLYT